MAKRTAVLHIQPFSEANTMEEMITASDLCILHFLVAYGTDVIKTVELVSVGFGKGIDLVDCRAALHEHAPSSPCLTPDVEICMYTHHDCSYCPTRFKDQDPCTIEKKKNSKTEFHSITKSSYVIYIIIQFLPERASICIHQKE